MTQLLALSGSLRKGSYNTALARAAQRHAPDGVKVEVATLHGVPLYDADVEAESGIPQAVLTLKAQVMAADGLMLFTPEYNNGVPGVFKNAIDWLSRADMKAVFGDRPTALFGTSPGGFGTASAQFAWLATLKLLGVRLYAGGMKLPRANTAFDAEGQLIDAAATKILTEQVAAFAAFASRS